MNKQVMVPEGIDWQKIPLQCREKAKICISLLWAITQWLLVIDEGTEVAMGIPISKKKWVDLVGNDYKHILDELEAAHLITRSKDWVEPTETEVGECKRHWINSAFLKNRSVLINVDTALWRKQAEYNQRLFDDRYEEIKDGGIPKFVYRKLREYIHENLSINITDEQIADLKKNPTYKYGEEIRLRTADENFIEQIRKCPTHLQVLPSDNYRVYSPITQMYHKLRPHLCGQKKPLVEVDLCSAQPIFVWKMAVDMFGETPDLVKWREHLEGGTLYETFIDELNRTLDEKKKITNRGEFKSKYWFQMLYGPNLRKPSIYKGVEKDDTLFRIVERDFPTMWEFLLKVKNGCSKRKDDFRRLSIEAQRSEARLILGGVCRDFMMKKSRSCIYTCHDSVLINPENVMFIIELISKHCNEMKICPALHIYDYRYKEGDLSKRMICGLMCEHNIPQWRAVNE